MQDISWASKPAIHTDTISAAKAYSGWYEVRPVWIHE